jgi:hypothetical protein
MPDLIQSSNTHREKHPRIDGLLRFKKGDVNPIIEYIRNRPRRNKNFLAVWVGDTGSGKTWSALSFAEELDPRFNVNDVVFTIEEFFERLRQYQIMWDKSPKKVKGRVIIFDEAGVGVNNRLWQSFSNKAINSVMQSFRYMNLIVIFTTPNFSFIDKASRELFHGYFETVEIDYTRKLAISKLKLFKRDHMNGGCWAVYPRLYNKYDGKVTRVTRLAIYKPSDKLIADYEVKRHAWASLKYAKFVDGITAMNKGGKVTMGAGGETLIDIASKRKLVDLSTLKNEFMKEPGLYLKQKRNGDIIIDVDLIKGTGKFTGTKDAIKLGIQKLYFDADVKEMFDRVKKGEIPLVRC